MYKDLSRYSKLKRKIKEYFGEQLVDMILFGSAAKGKTNPNDYDVCIILRNPPSTAVINEISSIINEKEHISFLSVDNFFNKFHSLAKTVFFEGRSILSGQRLAEKYSLKSFTLFTYDLSKESATKKVRFVQVLRGRKGNKGRVSELNGEFISNKTFMIPIEKDEEIINVFNFWNVKFTRKKIMLMN